MDPDEEEVGKMCDNPAPNPAIVLREEFDNWAILFNPDTGKALAINPTGIAIWRNINGQNNIKNITSKIEDSFSEVPEAANKEISNFMDILYKEGFIGYNTKGRT